MAPAIDIGRRATLAALACLATAPRRVFAQTPAALSAADFAAPDLGRPVTRELQAALDASFETGLPLVFPRGEWVIDAPLRVTHTARGRRGFPRISGAGPGSTRLRALAFDGPMVAVRGAPFEKPAGTFFLWGGGFEGVDFIGAGGVANQGAIEALGWWNGTLRNCGFSRFGGHALRAIGDAALDSNPDWTASILRVEHCMFERLRGWGFLDDNPIGAPGWIFDHCVFVLCGAGGAFTRSSGTQFLGCSFSGCGFLDERTPAPGLGVGLRIGDAGRTTINRVRVVVAEFDSNKDAHILIDRATSFLIEDARFIHNDRYRTGDITPKTAVLLGAAHPRSLLANGRVARPLVRIDHKGEVTGYRLETREARDLVIEPEHFAFTPGDAGVFTRLSGFPDAAGRTAARIRVPDDP